MTNLGATSKGIIHGLVSVVLFAIPLLVASNAPVLDLTIGGILNAVYHFLLGYVQQQQ